MAIPIRVSLSLETFLWKLESIFLIALVCGKRAGLVPSLLILRKYLIKLPKVTLHSLCSPGKP